MVSEAGRSREWDMSCLFHNLEIGSTVPVHAITALAYVVNLSQGQYQMCRNLLKRFGIQALPPRSEVDAFKANLHLTVTVTDYSASVSVESLFHSTLYAIITNDSTVQEQLKGIPAEAKITFSVEAALDWFRSHSKRQQLSGDFQDDAMLGSPVDFLGLFMTPLSISAKINDYESKFLWENPTPNSIFFTRPIQLIKVKESLVDFISTIFSDLQASFDSLRSPRIIPGIANNVVVDTSVTMLDGKMTDIVQGDSGAFCHYCDVNLKEASSVDYLAKTGAGGMPITKTVEECLQRWELTEGGEIAYTDPRRRDQCHRPLTTQLCRLFAILHQKLRTLDFALKILYQLVAELRVWSEVGQEPKAKITEAKIVVVNHIKLTCKGLLVDSPTSAGVAEIPILPLPSDFFMQAIENKSVF